METVACALCGSHASTPVIRSLNRMWPAPGRELEEFTVVRCRACGLLYTNPRPTEAEIGPYYEGYPYRRASGPPAPVPPAPRAAEPGALARLLRLGNPGLPELPPGSRVLEVGCATGTFMVSLADRGWHLSGIEPSPDAAAYARDVRGLDVTCATIASVPFADGTFDLVYGWQVVEHFAHPADALGTIRRLLKPGGTVCLSLPNAGALERRVFGRHWSAWHLPVHYYHYTPATIAAMLVKAGFERPSVQHQRNISNLLQSAGLASPGIPMLRGLVEYLRRFGDGVPHEAAVGRALRPLAVLLAAAGQGGRMTVTARVRSTPPDAPST